MEASMLAFLLSVCTHCLIFTLGVARQLYYVVSAVCILIGATTTHGLGGQLRHASPADVGAEISQRWRFFQPFQ